MTILGVFTPLHLLILCAIIYVMTNVSPIGNGNHASLLAEALSSKADDQKKIINYFQDSINDQGAREATQALIVDILSQNPEKIDAFFETLDTIFQQPSFTNSYYGPIEDIVSALNEAGINIYTQVADLANNLEWGSRLYDLLQLNDEAQGFYDNHSSEQNQGDDEEPVILKFPSEES